MPHLSTIQIHVYLTVPHLAETAKIYYVTDELATTYQFGRLRMHSDDDDDVQWFNVHLKAD